MSDYQVRYPDFSVTRETVDPNNCTEASLEQIFLLVSVITLSVITTSFILICTLIQAKRVNRKNLVTEDTEFSEDHFYPGELTFEDEEAARRFSTERQQSLSELYDVLPPQPELTKTAIRRRSVFQQAILEEEEEDDEEDESASHEEYTKTIESCRSSRLASATMLDSWERSDSRAFYGRQSRGNNLRLPEHSNLHRSPSQEMIDQLNRFVFTDHAMFDYETRPKSKSPNKSRHQSGSIDGGSKFSLDALESLIGKKTRSTSSDATEVNSPTESRRGSFSPNSAMNSLMSSFSFAAAPGQFISSKIHKSSSNNTSNGKHSNKILKTSKSVLDDPEEPSEARHDVEKKDSEQAKSTAGENTENRPVRPFRPSIRSQKIQMMVDKYDNNASGENVDESILKDGSTSDSSTKGQERIPKISFTMVPDEHPVVDAPSVAKARQKFETQSPPQALTPKTGRSISTSSNLMMYRQNRRRSGLFLLHDEVKENSKL